MRRRLAGAWRRSTTRSPDQATPGTTLGGSSEGRYTIPPMRRWSELAERVAATTRTSEKTSPPRRLPRAPDARRAADRGRLPVRAARSRRPTSAPTGLGWAAIAAAVAELAGARRARSARRTTARPTSGMAVSDVLTAAGHAAPDDDRRPSPRSPRHTRRSRPHPGPAAKARPLPDLLARSDPLTAKYIVKVLSGELRIGLREGLLEAAIAQAFDRPLDDVKWAGMLTGDVGRTGRRSPATTASTTPRWRCSTRSSSCSRRRPRTPRRSWAGSGRPSGSRTSTTASAPSSTARDGGPPLQPRPPRHQRPVPGGRRRRARRSLGRASSTASCWPGRDGEVLPFLALQARLGPQAPRPRSSPRCR